MCGFILGEWYNSRVNDDDGNLVKIKAKDLLPFAWKPVDCE